MLDDERATDQGRLPAERAVDRRQLLKAGAWAAPVLVVAGAAPAAVASPVVVQRNVFRMWAGSIWTWAGTIGVSVSLQYDSGAWGNIEPATPPLSMTASWLLEAVDPNGVSTTIAQRTEPFAPWVTRTIYDERAGFVVGQTYLVRFQTLSYTFSPPSSNGVTFAAYPLEESADVTVSQRLQRVTLRSLFEPQ